MSSWDKEWAMCFSGRRVFPFDLKPQDIVIMDIAHALSMEVRYNGHVNREYTVGEHCIRIADALFRDFGDPNLALKGLLHDAGEAYTGDFTRPVKNSMREVGEILHTAEDHNEEVIMTVFGLHDFDDHGKIKDYDRRIIVDEKTALFGTEKPWDWDLVPLGVPIVGFDPEARCYDWHWKRVKREYLDRFHSYSSKAIRA